MSERTSRSADKNIHTMTTPHERVWGFGARSAQQGTDEPIHGHGDGMAEGNSTTL